MTEKLRLAYQVAEKFLKLNNLEKEFALGYITGKRDQKKQRRPPNETGRRDPIF